MDSDAAVQVADVKRQQRRTWAAGDYPKVAEHIWEVGHRIVHRMHISPGDDVLDVACGTGNAAIRAAQAGGTVTGVDLTPELFDAARTLAAEANVEITFVEGDAEALQFDNQSFDVVLSTFGCMFAPQHAVVAKEISRVLRPDGRFGLCNWTPEGAIGGFFAVVGKHLPPLPSFATPPPLWGNEDHVRSLFSGTGVELSFDREIVELSFDSVPDILSFYETNFGPIIKAREMLEPQGKWLALREDMLAYFERETKHVAGKVVWPGEYLVVMGHKRQI